MTWSRRFQQLGLSSRIAAMSLGLLLLVQAAVFSVVQLSIDRNARRQIAQELIVGERVWRRLLDQNAQKLEQIDHLAGFHPVYDLFQVAYRFPCLVQEGMTVQLLLDNLQDSAIVPQGLFCISRIVFPGRGAVPLEVGPQAVGVMQHIGGLDRYRPGASLPQVGQRFLLALLPRAQLAIFPLALR